VTDWRDGLEGYIREIDYRNGLEEQMGGMIWKMVWRDELAEWIGRME
jgi:hypothetical protein